MLRVYGDRILLVELVPISTERLFYDGDYHFVDPRINSVNFPMSMPELTTEGVYLAGFSRTARTEEIERGVRSAGFCFADHRRLLALGASHPDLCSRNPIAALGSSYTEDFYDTRVVTIVSVLGHREARIAPRNNWWHSGWRFVLER